MVDTDTLFRSPLQDLSVALTVLPSILNSMIGSGLAFLAKQSIVSTPVCHKTLFLFVLGNSSSADFCQSFSA
jgi:hypothetical protein